MSSRWYQSAFSGLLWSAVEIFGGRGVQFVVQIVLARLLLPQEFGLVAMVIVFIALGTGITDAGMSQAVIQRQELSPADISTVFYLNIALGSIMAVALCLGAPLVAAFYHQPQLTPILQVLSMVLVLDALGRIHLSLLQKELRFKKVMLASLPAIFLSGGIGITMAWLGFGVWSLVGQQISQRAIQSTILWISSPIRIGWEFSISSLKALLPFGSRFAASGIVNQLFSNIYALVIGKVFGVSELGYYQQADNIKNQVSFNLASVISRVTFPVFSKLQTDIPKLAKALLQSTKVMSLLTLPIMALLAGVADPLIITLIGQKWRPSVPLLQILCVVGASLPLSVLGLSVVSALGYSKLYLRLEIIKKTLYVAGLALTWRLGLEAIAVGSASISIVAFLLNCYCAGSILKISIWTQLKPLVPALVAAGAIFTVSWSISRAVGGPAINQLALSAGGGFMSMGICLFLFRIHFLPEFNSAKQFLPFLARFDFLMKPLFSVQR